MITFESDLNLTAACVLLRINIEAAEERAAILEHNGGLTRDAANREAFVLALKARDRRFSRRLANAFFDSAGLALEIEQERGWNRRKTWDWIFARLRDRKSAFNVAAPESERIAV